MLKSLASCSVGSGACSGASPVSCRIGCVLLKLPQPRSWMDSLGVNWFRHYVAAGWQPHLASLTAGIQQAPLRAGSTPGERIFTRPNPSAHTQQHTLEANKRNATNNYRLQEQKPAQAPTHPFTNPPRYSRHGGVPNRFTMHCGRLSFQRKRLQDCRTHTRKSPIGNGGGPVRETSGNIMQYWHARIKAMFIQGGSDLFPLRGESATACWQSTSARSLPPWCNFRFSHLCGRKPHFPTLASISGPMESRCEGWRSWSWLLGHAWSEKDGRTKILKRRGQKNICIKCGKKREQPGDMLVQMKTFTPLSNEDWCTTNRRAVSNPSASLCQSWRWGRMVGPPKLISHELGRTQMFK